MTKFCAYLLLMAGAACQAFAQVEAVPEINASAAVGAISLVSGAILILRTRRK